MSCPDQIQFVSSVSQVGSEEWDHLAGTLNPFVSHAFLQALEKSGCVGERTGWIPYPLTIRDSEGRLVAAAPSYIKLHSKGEYIFDYHWAEAYHRLQPGLDYYPKLQVAVPYTPVPGPRLLVSSELPKNQQQKYREKLLNALREQAESVRFSSAHITFCEEVERTTAQESSGFLSRLGEQYHWFNEGYENFDDFLAALTSRKRKNIKKERRKAQSHGLEIHTFHGNELTDSLCLQFFRMYEKTCLRKWGQPYLNLAFFQEIAARLGDRLVLFLVRDTDGKWIAGAWNLRGDKTLFGRNWGCLRDYDCLHFEVCYYRALEYAIEHGLEKVEAGAQGLHKIQRGSRPRAVHSAHFFEPGPFRGAIEQYLLSERLETEFRLEALTDLEPFRRD